MVDSEGEGDEGEEGKGANEAFPDEDAEGGGGGLTLEGEERFVVVEAGEGGLWEVWWDERDDGLKGCEGVAGRTVLRCSLDREFVEGRKGGEGGKDEGGKEEGIRGTEGEGKGKEGEKGAEKRKKEKKGGK